MTFAETYVSSLVIIRTTNLGWFLVWCYQQTKMTDVKRKGLTIGQPIQQCNLRSLQLHHVSKHRYSCHPTPPLRFFPIHTLTTTTTTHLPGGRRMALPQSPLSQPKQNSKYITIGVNADWLHSYVRVGTYVCTYVCIYVCSMYEAGNRWWESTSSPDSVK